MTSDDLSSSRVKSMIIHFWIDFEQLEFVFSTISADCHRQCVYEFQHRFCETKIHNWFKFSWFFNLKLPICQKFRPENFCQEAISIRNPRSARPNDRFGPWIPDFDKNRFENREFQIIEQIPNWSVSTNSEICFELTNKIFEMSHDARAPPYFQK